jgi:hypothetical protein
MAQKLNWPPEAVKLLLDWVEENKSERGKLQQGNKTIFLDWARDLREQFSGSANFGSIVQSRQVENKLKSLWETYKAKSFGKKAPIKHFYVRGAAALDREKLRKQLKGAYDTEEHVEGDNGTGKKGERGEREGLRGESDEEEEEEDEEDVSGTRQSKRQKISEGRGTHTQQEQQQGKSTRGNGNHNSTSRSR